MTPHVLRAWERRYHIVHPSRSEGGQRLYSDLDVQRLKLIRSLSQRGHSLAQLGSASLEDLERRAQEDSGSRSLAPQPPVKDTGAEEIKAAVLEAARRLDAAQLQVILEQAAVNLGVLDFLEQVAGPSLQRVGQGWSDGNVSVAQEHLATAVFRRVLGWILRVYEVSHAAPRLVVATPPRQAHELGAMLAAAAAAAQGWEVTYLGADLPIGDIVAAAKQVDAMGVALSIVYPASDPGLVSSLEQLRAGLDMRSALLLGGGAAAQDRERLTALGAQVIDSLPEFRAALQRLRARN